jgi:outer membrane lipoprotein SlyB
MGGRKHLGGAAALREMPARSKSQASEPTMNTQIFSLKSAGSTLLAAAVALSLTAGSGCARNSARHYTRDEALNAQMVDYGTVVSVVPVTIESGEPPVKGAMGGAMIGGGTGYALGHDHRDGKLAVAGGALLGAAAGAMAEKAMTTHRAYEIAVRMDTGETISIVQEADIDFQINQRVRVLTGANGRNRVAP